MAEARRLVIIEDGLLATMAGSAQYVAQFPFLAALQNSAKKTGGCNSCGRAARQRIDTFNSAKAAVAALDADAKRKLKEMLNAKEARVRYKDGPKIVELTF